MEASSMAARPASVSRRWRRLRRARRQAVFEQIYNSHKENSSLDGIPLVVPGSVTKSKASWSVVSLDEAALNSVLVWLIPANHVTHKAKFASLVLAVSWSLYRCCCSCPTPLAFQAPLGIPPQKLILLGLHISGLLMIGRWYHRNVFRNQGKPWMDPAVVGWNRRPMHALLRYHTDEQTAREAAVRPGAKTSQQQSTTQNVLNLDGNKWEFRLERTVEDALDVVLSPDLMDVQYDSSTGKDNPAHIGSDGSWKKMDVPSNWTCRGFDRPIYTNVKYPFPCVPPYVPIQSPAGIYRRLISLPEIWNRTDSQYSLILHGVESCAFVFWNEILIGFSKDSRLPSEFDVTSALFQKRKAHNTCTYQPHLLQVVVPRFSDGSYLEDQDHWWMAGLHRSVELVKKPKNTSLIDYAVEADMDGRLKVEISIGCAANERNKEGELLLIAKLHEDDQSSLTGTGGRLIRGEIVFSQSVAIPPKKCIPNCEASADIQEYRLEGNITNPRLWSAEIPNLYTLTLSIVDHDGTCRQSEACRVGFRTVDISSGTLRVNRRKITICGVNHHEHDPDNGKVVSFESMRRDVELLKQNNFNAVRLSHYPHASSFYDLCDYYGLYVCDESNIETHGMMPMGKLAQDWGWRDAFVSRVKRMVQRDRNHPSIIIWSLGNESGKGRNLTAARDMLRTMDSTRPIVYESGGALFEGTGISDLTDIACPMYPTVEQTVNLGTRKDEGRPVILCEYSHAMGNSNGNLDEYWKHFWDKDKPRLQGGFIWDMIDQGLRRVNKTTGKDYFAYGDTDCGDINDRQFCINGLYSPDRVPHPAVAEVKYLQQPVQFTLDSETSSGVTLAVTNRYSFQSTAKLKWTWFVTSCDKMNEERIEGLFSFSAPPENSRTLARINFDSGGLDSAFRRGERCWLTIHGSLIDDVSWAREGHIVVKEQIELNYRVDRNERSSILNEAMAKVGLQTIDIQNDTESKLITVFLCNLEQRSTLATIDASTGALLSYNTPQGYSVLDIDEDTGMQPNVTRASTDNDKGGFDLIVQILVPKWVSWILQPLIFLGVLDRSHHYHWNKCNLDPMAPPKSVCCKAIVDNNINDNDAIIRLESAIISQRDGSELFRSVMTYHFFANGCVQVTYNLCPCKQIQKLSSLPRVGVSMTIDKSLYKINYFGRGPHENYPDRKSSAFMGVWGASPNHMGSYIVPGENSARMDCEWVTFQNEDGKGICILGDDGGGDHEYTPLQYQRQAAGEDSAHSSFSFSALLHTQKELHAATNTCHLGNREEGKHNIHVNLDHKIHGVGDSAWLPCSKYVVKPNRNFEFSFWMIPLVPDIKL